MQVTKIYIDDTPVELADEIEHGKALILEKLDALTELRTKLRQDYVPLTVCNHLEQCIKETEVRILAVTVEQIRRVFDDNLRIIFVISP